MLWIMYAHIPTGFKNYSLDSRNPHDFIVVIDNKKNLLSIAYSFHWNIKMQCYCFVYQTFVQ